MAALHRSRPLSLRGGNGSSCPKGDTRSQAPTAALRCARRLLSIASACDDADRCAIGTNQRRSISFTNAIERAIRSDGIR